MKSSLRLNKRKNRITIVGASQLYLTGNGLIIFDSAYRSRILFSIANGTFSFSEVLKDWEFANAKV